MHNDQWDFDDYGLSIDAALALQAVGGHDDVVTAVGQAIRAHYYSYTSGADWGSDDRYAGATAKAGSRRPPRSPGGSRTRALPTTRT
jgi:hypothetical protein